MAASYQTTETKEAVPPVEKSGEGAASVKEVTIASLAFKVWIGSASHSVMSPEDTGASGAGSIVSVTAVLVSELQSVPSATASA